VKLDNVEKVEYKATMKPGWLTSIEVIFDGGHIIHYDGSGLQLALDLLQDQFPPKTDAERSLVERRIETPIDFAIDTHTLEISASLDKLKGLSKNQLFGAQNQAQRFRYFLAGGRSFDIEGLLKQIQEEMDRKKDH
jgi:hypothetical protein